MIRPMFGFGNQLFLSCFICWFHLRNSKHRQGFPGGSVVKNLPTKAGDSFIPWVRKIPWRREWQPTPVFLPGKSHGQRSLAGHSPWGRNSQTRLSCWEFTQDTQKLPHLLAWLRFNATVCKTGVITPFHEVLRRISYLHTTLTQLLLSKLPLVLIKSEWLVIQIF